MYRSWRNRWSVLRWSSGHGGGVWQWRQTISSATLYDRTRGFATTVRHNSLSNKEKQIWVIRGKKTKAKGNNRKRPSLIQRKNENWKKKRRRNKCPVLSGDLKSSKEVVCELLEEAIQTVANGCFWWTKSILCWCYQFTTGFPIRYTSNGLLSLQETLPNLELRNY